MNLGEITQEVLDTLRLVAGSEVFWTPDDILESINDGIAELSDFAEYRREVAGIQIGERTYIDLKTAVPNMLYPIAIYDPTLLKWRGTDGVRDIDTQYVRWENVYGNVDRLFMRGTFWLGCAFKNLSRATWKLWATVTGKPLEIPSDNPDFQDEFHDALVNYAVYDLLCQDREVEKGLLYWGKFLETAQKLKTYVETRNQGDHWQEIGGVV